MIKKRRAAPGSAVKGDLRKAWKLGGHSLSKGKGVCELGELTWSWLGFKEAKLSFLSLRKLFASEAGIVCR